MERVELGPIQKAVTEYLATGHTWSDICKSLGWMQTPTKPESARLQRALGFRNEGSKRRVQGKLKRKRNLSDKRINHDTAVKIIRAIDRAPNEFDL